MGKATAAQIKEKALAEVHPKERLPHEGIIIKLKGTDKAYVFDGDFEVQLTPAGVVCVLEMVPDVANKNKGQAIPTIRQFINSDVWTEVIIK